MDAIFSLGINSLWDELRQMPTGGIWWINTEQHDDAVFLANSTIAAQSEDARVAIITMGNQFKNSIELDHSHGPKKIRLFTMTDSQKSLYSLAPDLACSVIPENYLFVLIMSDGFCQNIPGEKIKSWLNEMSRWVRQHACSLLVINPDNNADKQFSLLFNQYRQLSGMGSIRLSAGEYSLDIAFWFNRTGVSARQHILLTKEPHGWAVKTTEKHDPQQREDERQILCHTAVLEGAPRLSEYWQLYPNNEALFNASRQLHAATVVFALEKNRQVDAVATHIHTLRKQRGSALKLVIRENQSSLRATDERLLMACGANIIIPFNAPLSRCLNMIESVQGQHFSRDVPDDITALTESLRPQNLRGFIPWDTFGRAVKSALSNPIAPRDGKGVLVALRPVQRLLPGQLTTLCKTNRTGDFFTLGDNRLVLFLSYCRINDLDVALRHIFPLPVGDIIASRTVWFADDDIAAELLRMRALPQAQWQYPMTAKNSAPALNAAHDGQVWRRVPVPVNLLLVGQEGVSYDK